MTLWLDDIREPWKHGYPGAEWVKTADAAISALKTGRYTFASLDHDLSEAALMLNLTPNDRNFLTALRIQAKEPIPFDAKAAETMIQLHGVAESRLRERCAELEGRLAKTQAEFARWIEVEDSRWKATADDLRWENRWLWLVIALIDAICIWGLFR